MKYEIKGMLPVHLDEVLAIERVSFPTPWSRQAFLGELNHNGFAVYFVCLQESRVIGYAGMWVIYGEAHITSIAVHPDYRGQKLGRALLEKLMQQAVKKGADRITLEVRPSNGPAQKLYQEMGFAPVGVRKGYYTDTNEDAIIMWKRLFNDTSKLRSC